MTTPLPPPAELRFSQRPGRFSGAELKNLDHAILVLPHGAREAQWRALPGGAQLWATARRSGRDRVVRGRLANGRATGLSARALKHAKPDSFQLLSFAGELLEDALKDQPASLGLGISGFDDELGARLAEALVLAAHARSFRMPAYNRKPPKQRKLTRLRLLGLPERVELAQADIAARAQNLARWLTALPPSHLDAAAYKQVAAKLAKEHGWKMRFLDEAWLRKAGAGAFLAVSQGNAKQDAGIIHLSYAPAGGGSRPPLALVGKGIIFDTGGNNLKPHKSMLDMHEDMAGSAVALATLQALTELQYDGPVDCWLAVTENRIGASAYRPRDVITASNGITIEVIHTDAEGRLVLADTLALAGKRKPKLIMDYATLTGACVYALTERYSGVFSNREALNEQLVAAGRRSGERVWPFPMDADFDEAIKSKAADVLQCSTEGSGDHILAARFLQRFLPAGCDWVHMDLSAASRREGLAHVPGGATGFGVRLSLDFLKALE